MQPIPYSFVSTSHLSKQIVDKTLEVICFMVPNHKTGFAKPDRIVKTFIANDNKSSYSNILHESFIVGCFAYVLKFSCFLFNGSYIFTATETCLHKHYIPE